ncbi:asparagine synthetase B [Nitrospira sp.]|nr:asparagine synthetase B [Nitrospira sp.]
MCGIAGILGPSTPDMMGRMLNALVHRGPDDHGHFRAPGVAIGARRLKVIDPGGGHQPLSNENGTVWVALNGEIYNYRSLREDLIHKGHRFRTECDTEVLAHLYEEEGPDGITRLRGMFAYMLWDQRAQRLVVARDRLGIKPLYYAVHHQTEAGKADLIAASELPALVTALREPRLRRDALVDYLTWLYVPAPDTIYEGVHQLLPGHQLICDQGAVQVRRYASIEPAYPGFSWSSIEEAAEHFYGLFRDAVRAHLASDVPLGLFLSGGLDSSAILAMMREATPGPIKTFSVGYGHEADRSYNELAVAHDVARRFETDHTEAVLRPDITALLPKVVRAMGEPFADSSSIPTYLVSEMARRRVTVALSGVGGDELFGGYPRHLGMRLAARYQWLPIAVRGAFSSLGSAMLPEGVDGRDNLGRLKRFLRWGTEPLADQYGAWTTHLPQEWGWRALHDDLALSSETQAVARARHYFEAWHSPDPADRAMGVDLQTYLPDDLLRLGDRMSMAHSLELRVPFCDHHLLAFALSLPASLRFRGSRLKGFLRHAFRHTLPPSVVDGPKLGFRVPLARWFKEDLAGMVGDLLGEQAVRQRGILRPAYVRWLVEEHRSGRRNLTDQLYAALVLELWMRQQAGTI